MPAVHRAIRTMIGVTRMNMGLGRAQRGPRGGGPGARKAEARLMARRPTLVAICALLLLASRPGAAQTLPSEPFVFADGHVTLGGDVSWSMAPQDTGFFNYSDYEHSTLRTLRLGVVASVKANEHL